MKVENAAERVKKQQRRLEIASIREFKKNIKVTEERLKKDQDDRDKKAKGNFSNFIEQQRVKQINASMDQVNTNKDIVGSLYNIESNLHSAK